MVPPEIRGSDVCKGPGPRHSGCRAEASSPFLLPCLEGLHPGIREQTKEPLAKSQCLTLLCGPDKQTTLSGLYFSLEIDFTEENGVEGEKGGRGQSPFLLSLAEGGHTLVPLCLSPLCALGKCFTGPELPPNPRLEVAASFSQSPECFFTLHPKLLGQVSRPGQHSHSPQGWQLA